MESLGVTADKQYNRTGWCLMIIWDNIPYFSMKTSCFGYWIYSNEYPKYHQIPTLSATQYWLFTQIQMQSPPCDLTVAAWLNFTVIQNLYEPRHEKTCLWGFRPEDSNRSAQLKKLARVMKLPTLKLEILYYLGSEHQRCWSDCVDAQADLHLCCLHMAKMGFLVF